MEMEYNALRASDNDDIKKYFLKFFLFRLTRSKHPRQTRQMRKRKSCAKKKKKKHPALKNQSRVERFLIKDGPRIFWSRHLCREQIRNLSPWCAHTLPRGQCQGS